MPILSRTTTRILLAAAAVAVLIFTAVYFTRPVARVQVVTGGTAINAVPGSVVVRAERDEQLRTEVSGKMLKTDMDDGKFVKEGEFLAQLDPGDLQLEIEKYEDDLTAVKRRVEVDKSAELELENAKAEFENATRIHKQGMMSDFDYQKQGRLLKQMTQKLEITGVANQQQIDSLENTLKTKKRQLEKMTVRAPFDCVISKVFVRQNALVTAGEPLAVLISVNRTVEAKISEENFSGVRVGQKAVVRFLGYEGTFEGVVEKMLPTADPETQRYLVHLDVQIDIARLIPGITGEVSIVIGERESKTLVPRRALFGHSVFVVKNGVVQARPVQLGFVSLNMVEVVGGLEPGEVIIVEQIDRFRNGQRVRTELKK
ncbi:MAG: efflux RND transporter periplasmic adaptor subunit [Opitutaceae bacterium]|nr:efflux RND transporter periplasmic adaptor subunit [Opitutaceae bacterium]